MKKLTEAWLRAAELQLEDSRGETFFAETGVYCNGRPQRVAIEVDEVLALIREVRTSRKTEEGP